VPIPCPGIGRALPAVLFHSAEQARQLVQHLLPADAQRLRTAALPCYPISLWHILTLSCVDSWAGGSGLLFALVAAFSTAST
jgi:hypothetical protein